MMSGLASNRSAFVLLAMVMSGFIWFCAGAAESKADPTEKRYDPENQRPLEVHRGDLAVSLAGKSEKFSLSVTRNSAATRSVALSDHFEQVNDLHWSPDGRLFIHGMFNSSGDVVAVVNLATLSIDDEFLGYGVAPSPDGRYLAFVRFFPAHGIEGVEHRVRLYDLTESPAQNRPIHSPLEGPEFEVGTPIYPVLSDEGKRANSGVPDADAYLLVSDFRWSSDSTRFSFGMEHAAHELYVVVAYPTRSVVASANISRACVYDCQSLRIEKVEFSKAGVEVEIVGFGNKNGQNTRLVIPHREFVSGNWNAVWAKVNGLLVSGITTRSPLGAHE